MKSGIYSITNIINQKIYIGSAVDIKKRWRDHRFCFLKNTHHNSHFQSSWNLYGESNFKFDVVEYCDKIIIKEREKYYINLFDSKNSEKGYNINDPDNGFLGIKHTEETKKKLSIQKLGDKNPMFGKGLKGEEKNQSKLTNDDVISIRSNYKIIPNKELAAKYNVSASLIALIVTRKRWKHI